MPKPRRLQTLIAAVCAAIVLPSFACGRSIVDDFGPVASLELLPTLWTDPTGVSDIVAGGFSVRSVIPFPCAPYALVPRVIVSGSTLTLRIEGRYENGCPQEITGLHSYRADVANVAAGSYQLLVIHAHREWARPVEMVFAGQITIP